MRNMAPGLWGLPSGYKGGEQRAGSTLTVY